MLGKPTVSRMYLICSASSRLTRVLRRWSRFSYTWTFCIRRSASLPSDQVQLRLRNVPQENTYLLGIRPRQQQNSRSLWHDSHTGRCRLHLAFRRLHGSHAWVILWRFPALDARVLPLISSRMFHLDVGQKKWPPCRGEDECIRPHRTPAQEPPTRT